MPPVYAVLLLAVTLLTLGQVLQKVAVDGCAGVQPASRRSIYAHHRKSA